MFRSPLAVCALDILQIRCAILLLLQQAKAPSIDYTNALTRGGITGGEEQKLSIPYMDIGNAYICGDILLYVPYAYTRAHIRH